MAWCPVCKGARRFAASGHHVACCEDCGEYIWAHAFRTCPRCRSPRRFYVVSEDGTRLRCRACGFILNEEEHREYS